MKRLVIGLLIAGNVAIADNPKGDLERIESSAVEASVRLTELQADWIKAVKELKAKGYDIDYDFIDILD